MRSIVAFFPAGPDRPAYEIRFEHEPGAYCPCFIAEADDGTIVDLSTDQSWSSIPEMTNVLKLEYASLVSKEEGTGAESVQFDVSEREADCGN